MTNGSIHVRMLGGLGGLLAAVSVGLAAFASHAATPEAGRRLAIAAAFGFGHGLALLVLPGTVGRAPALAGLYALAVGVLLFAGSLALAALLGTGTALAPAGGMAMMLGWLAVAISRLRG